MLAKMWAVLAVVLGSFVFMSRGDLVEIVPGRRELDENQVRFEGRIVGLHRILRSGSSFLAEVENGDIVIHSPGTRARTLTFQGARGPTRQVVSVIRISSSYLVHYSDESVDALSTDGRRKTVYGIKSIEEYLYSGNYLLLKTNGEVLVYRRDYAGFQNFDLDNIASGPIEHMWKVGNGANIFVQQDGVGIAQVHSPILDSPAMLKFNSSEVKHMYASYSTFVLRGHDDIVKEYDARRGFILEDTYSLADFREVSDWCGGFYTVDVNGTIGGFQSTLVRTWPVNATRLVPTASCSHAMFMFPDGSLEMRSIHCTNSLCSSAKTTLGVRQTKGFDYHIAVLDEGDNIILLPGEKNMSSKKYSFPEGSVKSLHSSSNLLAVEFEDGSFLITYGDLSNNVTLPSTTELFTVWNPGFYYVSERDDSERDDPPDTQQNFPHTTAFAVAGVVGLVGLAVVGSIYFQSNKKKAEQVGQPSL